jgi:enterochelin esterase family protein
MVEPVTEPPHSARLAIRRLQRRPQLDAAAVDEFLASHAFPLVEGTSVTFVYRGEADAVNLKHWIYGLGASQPFQRLGETDLWYLILELPEGSRVEYKLEVVQGGTGQWIEDPLNPHRARDPFGANSVCLAKGYEIPEWTRPDAEARAGTLEEVRLASRALRRTVPVTLYRPSRFRETRRYPLLVVHDGTDYLRYAGLKTVLDNLIHRLEIPGLLVAMIDSPHRLEEYANHAPHARFLADELLPELGSALPLENHPDSRCLMGSSLGAVAAFSAAWHRPGFFGRLLLQSGSFAFSDIGDVRGNGDTLARVIEFVNGYRDDPIPVAQKIFLSCGTYESLIYENRSLVPLLQNTGMDVRYVEARDGHNWENWRDRLREGLSWLFPGPLWMVYE